MGWYKSEEERTQRMQSKRPNKANKPKTKFTPSPYQQAIFNATVERLGTDRHIIVQACAGSGKTKTGVDVFKLVPMEIDAAFVAFNKPIEMDLRAKLPFGTTTRTYHALGLKVLADSLGHIDVDKDKVRTFLLDNIGENDRWMVGSTAKLTNLCKAFILPYPDERQLKQLAFEHDVPLYDEYSDMTARKIFELVKAALEYSIEVKNVVDFADMIFLPNVLPNEMLSFHIYDFLFADEFQDTDVGQFNLLLQSIKPDTGLLLAVGDRYQSIYGWRGADSSAMDNFKEQLNAEELPLSLCYRCPTKVRDLVNQTFPHIQFESPGWAIEGVVRDLLYDHLEREAQPEDMILCRTNAPLVPAAFSFIKNGKKSVIKGREIGKGLLTMIRKSKASSLSQFAQWLEVWQTKEIAKAVKIGSTNKIATIRDKHDILKAIMENSEDVEDVTKYCEILFSDDVVGITLSSVHRAKGLEADNVFLLRPDLMPHPAAKTIEAKQQEDNVKYVAYTRAKKSLTIVHGGE